MIAYKISVIRGDGIGPELTSATLEVLEAVQQKFGLKLSIVEAEAGDACFEKRGVALPEDSIQKIKESHTCLKGPVGETAADVIVKLRLMFDLYANMRPIKAYPAAAVARPDIDMIFVRENTEDVYKGQEFIIGNDTTICLRVITRGNCERISRKGFETARRRNGKKKVTAIHKANVMRVTDGLFASVCRETAKQYPDVAFNELYVDAASMRLIKEPQEFDVLVTCNMFGDILSDEAAQLVGGLGFAASGNIGDNYALFEPTHGSAPKYAGQYKVNPIAMLISTRLMLEYLNELDMAKALDDAIAKVIAEGKVRTYDMGGSAGTLDVANAVAKYC